MLWQPQTAPRLSNIIDIHIENSKYFTWNYVFVKNFFREVGEGTNEPIDLDKHDQYYHHLFYGITKKQNCRCLPHGIGFWNIPKVRNKWFYLNDLFRFEPELYDMMHKSMVALYHQRINKTNATFLLWRESCIPLCVIQNTNFCWEAWVLAINFLISRNHWWLSSWNRIITIRILYIHLQKKRTK
jgi:hypothetical protein